MSQLFTIQYYFANLGVKTLLGNELGHLGHHDSVFHIFCEQNQLPTFPIDISTKLNQVKSWYHANFVINSEFHKCGNCSDKLLSCQLFNLRP